MNRSAPDRVEQFRRICAPWLAAVFPTPSPDDPDDDRLDEFRSNLAYVDALVADGAIAFLGGEVDAQTLQVPDQARNELEGVIAATADFANDASSLAGRIFGYAMLIATVLNAADQVRVHRARGNGVETLPGGESSEVASGWEVEQVPG